MTTTNVLITGANRGIGRALAAKYLARPNHTVIAAVRSTTAESAQSLTSLPKGENSSLHIVQIDSKSDTDADTAVAQLKSAGITTLDIVVANAGIANVFEKVDTISLDSFREFFEVNTLGPLKVFKATAPLLKAAAEAKGTPSKLVGITTMASSTENIEENKPYLLGSYGASKAALNHLVRRAHVENDWLTGFVINPGFAQTDMGNAGAKFFGFEQAFVTVEDSVSGIIKTIDNATRESNGKGAGFYEYDGTPLTY